MAGGEFASRSVVDLIGRLPALSGLIDTSLDWQYMIEVITVARAKKPNFQFISGTEYMISAAAIGATGLLSPLASVAPVLVRDLYRTCRSESYAAARPLQEDAAILFRLLRETGVPGFKAATAMLGRQCGEPRPPLAPWRDCEALYRSLSAAKSFQAEPRGWS
jgi:4-hydroxy-tetrahydrodipicolinate synthase